MPESKPSLLPVHRLGKHGAIAKDGRWWFAWVEDNNTPWHTEYRPTGQWVLYPSLRQARLETANGGALQQMVYDCEAILRNDSASTEQRELAEKRLAYYAAMDKAA